MANEPPVEGSVLRANVYEGAPDARQSDDPALPVSRFRPRYRALSAHEKEVHDDLKTLFAQIEDYIEHEVSAGRYRSLAITALEESCMWAVKQLTANPDGDA